MGLEMALKLSRSGNFKTPPPLPPTIKVLIGVNV